MVSPPTPVSLGRQAYNKEALRIFGNNLPHCPGCSRTFPEAAVLKDHMTACPAYGCTFLPLAP
jgi:hypothetical protein